MCNYANILSNNTLCASEGHKDLFRYYFVSRANQFC